MPEQFAPEPEAQNVPDLSDEELRAPYTPEGLPMEDGNRSPEADEEEWRQEVPSTEIVCLCLHQLPLRLSWHSASTHESRLCVSHCLVLSHVVRALFVMLRFHRPLLGYPWLCCAMFYFPWLLP